jgi:endonuclease YncB( thermonuclease family)
MTAIPESASESGTSVPSSSRPRRRWLNPVRLSMAGAALVALTFGVFLGSKVSEGFGARQSGFVTGFAQVIDGATIMIGNQVLHLQGIDAPPTGFVCQNGAWQLACGARARQALEREIADRRIECRSITTEANGQIVAQCITEYGLDLAARQVEAGWAVVDLREHGRYLSEENLARDEQRGLWRDDFARPMLWRRAADISG